MAAKASTAGNKEVTSLPRLRRKSTDFGVSKAVLVRVSRNLENHFNYEIRENSFITHVGSQKEALMLYNFAASKEFQQFKHDVPKIVKPRVRKSLRHSISSPYIRCLVKTTNEVMSRYPVGKLERFHTQPVLQPEAVAASPAAVGAESATRHSGSSKTSSTRRVNDSESRETCRRGSRQSPRRLQNYRPHVANMLNAQNYIDFWNKQESTHHQQRRIKSAKADKKKLEAREAARRFIEEPEFSTGSSKPRETSENEKRLVEDDKLLPVASLAAGKPKDQSEDGKNSQKIDDQLSQNQAASRQNQDNNSQNQESQNESQQNQEQNNQDEHEGLHTDPLTQSTAEFFELSKVPEEVRTVKKPDPKEDDHETTVQQNTVDIGDEDDRSSTKSDNKPEEDDRSSTKSDNKPEEDDRSAAKIDKMPEANLAQKVDAKPKNKVAYQVDDESSMTIVTSGSSSSVRSFPDSDTSSSFNDGASVSSSLSSIRRGNAVGQKNQ